MASTVRELRMGSKGFAPMQWGQGQSPLEAERIFIIND